MIGYAERGQLIDWDEDNSVFFNKIKEGFFDELELRTIFRQIIQGLDYSNKFVILVVFDIIYQ